MPDPRLPNALRPVHDQRHPHAAPVRVALVPAQRGVPHLRPAPGDVGHASRRPDVIQLRLHRIRIIEEDRTAKLRIRLARQPSIVGHPARAAPARAERARRTALAARPVVARHDQDRVVQLVDLAEEAHQPADLLVRVVHERRERLLQPCGEALLVLRQLRPELHARIVRRQPRPRRDDAQLELPLVGLLSHDIPALVEAPAILLPMRRRRLMRLVHRPQRQVQKERLVAPIRHLVAHELDPVIHQILSDVIPLFGRPRRLDVVVVIRQLGVELVRRPAQEAVVAIEPAL